MTEFRPSGAPVDPVFILGGAAESVLLARALADALVPVVLAFESVPRGGGPLPDIAIEDLATDDAALCDRLASFCARAVVDATHPFSDVPSRAAPLCRDLGLPYLRLRRPAWTPGPGDHWTEVADTETAARLIPAGARVFVTTGRQSLDGLKGLRDAHLVVRQLGSPRPVPDMRNATFRFETGPFSVAQEQATFADQQISALLCNNSGGTSSRSKLDAARALGLPVFLRTRPASPSGVREVDCLEDAMDWVAEQ